MKIYNVIFARHNNDAVTILEAQSFKEYEDAEACFRKRIREVTDHIEDYFDDLDSVDMYDPQDDCNIFEAWDNQCPDIQIKLQIVESELS